MRIVKASTVRSYWQRHPDAESWLRAWKQVAKAAHWRSIQDVRRDYPHADAAMAASGNTVTIFNVAGNKYRLIVAIRYSSGFIFIRDFLTHAEYDKGKWKGRH